MQYPQKTENSLTPNQTAIAREAAAHLYPDHSNIERLILTAAARIVKESGAVEALEARQNYISYLVEADHMTAGYLHCHNWKYPQEFLGRGAALRAALDATTDRLAALRALQEPTPARPEK